MDFTKNFKGTLFRFPLRTPAQAAASRISHKGHAPQEAAQLLRDFADEASAMLLFLKTVERVEVSGLVGLWAWGLWVWCLFGWLGVCGVPMCVGALHATLITLHVATCTRKDKLMARVSVLLFSTLFLGFVL